MIKHWAGLLLLILLVAMGTRTSEAGATSTVRPTNAAGRVLRVSPDSEYTTIQAALDVAQDNDVIEVHGGVYPGPLLVEKSVILRGVDRPVIDGGGQGTVVTLAAPGITFEGFEVRNSGVEPDRDHAGITVTGADVTVQNNRLSEVLFGIFLAQADGGVVCDNEISSKSEYNLARKGDGIRVWYSQKVKIENNHVHDARDVVMWYSNGSSLRNNTIENGRYGVHLMYANDMLIQQNRVLNNSVGIYTMYSKGVKLIDNLVRGQHGTSGYALGFKDSEQVEARGNLLVDNRSAIYTDGTPFSPGSTAVFSGNILAYNDIGVTLLTSTRGATFLNNTFWENYEQVAIQGGGHTGENLWQANYWSDYAGFDIDNDGKGEQPYQSDRFFEGLTDREPLLRALAYSPAAQAVEFAASSFPVVKPQAKFVDPLPSTLPAVLPGLDGRLKSPLQVGSLAGQGSRGLAATGSILLAVCVAGWFVLRREPF